MVTAAETGFRVHTDENGRDTILAPDVGFIAKARIPAQPVKQYAPLAPDLAVEIVSPNDSANAVLRCESGIFSLFHLLRPR